MGCPKKGCGKSLVFRQKENGQTRSLEDNNLIKRESKGWSIFALDGNHSCWGNWLAVLEMVCISDCRCRGFDFWFCIFNAWGREGTTDNRPSVLRNRKSLQRTRPRPSENLLVFFETQCRKATIKLKSPSTPATILTRAFFYPEKSRQKHPKSARSEPLRTPANQNHWLSPIITVSLQESRTAQNR